MISMRNYLRAINAYLQMGNHMRPGKLMISKATPFMAAAKVKSGRLRPGKTEYIGSGF